MSWRLRSIRVCLKGSRICIALLNTLLALTALLLSSLAFALTVYDSLPIPAFALERVSGKLNEQGLEIHWENISADLSGGLVIEKLNLTDRETQATVFTCDFLYADFNFWAAFQANPFALHAVFLQGAALYAYPQLSLSGTEEPLAQISTLRFQVDPHALQIETAILSSGSHLIIIDGASPLPLFEPSSAPQTAFDWQKSWIDITEQINRLQNTLIPAPQTHLHLHLSVGPNQSLLAEGHLTTPQIELPNGLILNELLLELPPLNLKEKPISLPSETAFFASSAQISLNDENDLRLNQIAGRLTGDPFSFTSILQMPETLALRAADLSYDDLKARTLRAAIALPSLQTEPRFTLRAGLEDLFIQIAGSLQREKTTAHLELSVKGDINTLLEIPSLHLTEAAEQTHFSPHLSLRGSIQLASGYRFQSADLNLTARQFSTRETVYDEVYTPIRITPTRLYFGPIAVYDPLHQSARGYYIQYLDTLDYRILAQGKIFPRRIDSLLPPFYTQLWESIDPGIVPDGQTPVSIPPVQADVDVNSRWQAAMTQTFLSIQGQGIRYKGTETSSLFTRIRQAKGFVELVDLDVSTPRGTFNGNIAWIYPQTDDDTQITRLQLHSTLPLPLLGTVFGTEIADLSTAFELTRSPTLSIEGEIKHSAEGPEEKNLHIEASVHAPLTAFDVPLEHLKVDAFLTNNTLDLRDLNLGFHQGRITGTAKLLLGMKEERPIILNASIENAVYSSALKTLETLVSGKKEPLPTFEQPNGRFNLTLNTNGDIGKWDRFIGTGSLQIRDAQLANIRLFGGLSKLFEEINLPLTSFRLNQLESNIILHPGQLYFYDLVATGPTGRIEAPGTINVPDGTIDFNSKVFFLGSNDAGTVGDFLGTVISPLAHAFELKLKGTLSQPKWSFKNSPFQWLNPLWKAGTFFFPSDEDTQSEENDLNLKN